MHDFSKAGTALAVLGGLLAGCSPWAVQTRMRVTQETPSTVLRARIPDMKQTGDTCTYSLVGWDVEVGVPADRPETVALEANNYAEGHVVRLDRPGYAPSTVPVKPRRPNVLKLGDLAGAGFYMVQSSLAYERGNKERSYVAAGLAGGFAGALTSGPWLLYPRKVTIAPGSRLPRRAPGQPDVSVADFGIEVAARDHTIYTYASMDDFIRRQEQEKETSLRSVSAAPEPLLDALNETLFAQGFLDTGAEQLFVPADALALGGRLEEVLEHRVGPFVTFQTQSRWWLHTPYGLPTDSTTVRTRSPWGFWADDPDGWERDLVGEALALAALEVADSSRMMKLIRPGRDFDAEWRKDWQPLAILPESAVQDPAVAGAAKAVVTIEASDGHGSGVIVGQDGWILTNWHVVEDSTLVYTVRFADGGTKQARIVRHHPMQDLAVLQVDSVGLPVVPLETRVPVAGEVAYAIGAPHHPELGASVSHGVVSAFRREGERPLLQTDASISPGNSGGALVNAAGRLVGIVTEKVIAEGVEGIGFAVPVDEVVRALGLARRSSTPEAQPGTAQ